MKNYFRLSLIATIGTLLFIPSVTAQLSIPNSKGNTSSLVAAQPAPENLRQIAQSITVKVYAGDSRGSGILIAKTGQLYTVLTNAHVVTRGDTYRIQTPDGKTYQAILKNKSDSLKGDDLAVLQFQATANYSIASLGDSSALAANQQIYTAGFPFEQENLSFITGKVSFISPKPLAGGYQIAYTNQTVQGMSGGAVLNQSGKLIGIVGMGANAILNDAYIYQDGSRPNETTLGQLRESSFAVPIATLAKVAPQLIAILPKPEPGNPGSTQNHAPYTGIVGNVDKIAEQITVRIDSQNNGNGSGVIVAKQGQTYYVLTARHVVKDQDNYTIVTPDGEKYSVSQSAIAIPSTGVDIAVMQFTSNQTYSVATLANDYGPDLTRLVFVSGFPANKNSSQRLLTGGTVFGKWGADMIKKDKYSFAETGRGLLYTNFSYPGMSGGPVLDKSGQVVGINTGVEGEIKFNQKDQPVDLNLGFSLGVPISNFVGLATQAKMQPEWLKIATSQPDAIITKDESISVQNQLFSLQVPQKDADAFAWLNYGNQLWRAKLYIDEDSEQYKRQDAQAVVAFDKAIQLKPDFYQAYYAKGFLLVNAGKYQEALESLKKATELDAKFARTWYLQAEAFNGLKKYSEALKSSDKAIDLERKNYVFYMQRGDILNSLKRYQDALAVYTEAINIEGNFNTYFSRSSFYRSCLTDYQSGNLFYESCLKYYQKAIADLNKAIEFDPNNVSWYMWRASMIYEKLAEMYEDLNYYRNAIADYTTAIKMKPTDHYYYFFRGIDYQKLGDHQKAIIDFTESIKLGRNDADAYYRRGESYQELKEYDKALNDFNKAIDLDKKDFFSAALYWSRGELYVKLNEYQKALPDFNKAVDVNPNISTAYWSRGELYVKLNEYQKALPDFNRVISLEQDFIAESEGYQSRSWYRHKQLTKTKQNMAYFYNERGQVYYKLKEYKKAITDFTQAIAINDKNEVAYNGRGNAYADLKEYQKAIADYTKAIEIDPKYVNAYYSRGSVYADLKEYQKAIADYTQAIVIDSEFVNAYNIRGLAYGNLKDYQKAIADYTKAIEIDPKFVTAYNNRGLAYGNLKEYQKAIADYTKAIEIDPKYVNAYNNRGLAYVELKEYEKALVDLNNATDIDSNLANPYSHRGRIYRELKEYPKALVNLNKAIELNPSYGKAYYNRGLVYKDLKDSSKAIPDLQKAAQLFKEQGDMENYQLAQEALK